MYYFEIRTCIKEYIIFWWRRWIVWIFHTKFWWDHSSVIINEEVYPVKIFWLQISFYLDMSFNLSHFGSCVVKHWKSAYRAESINGQIQNWTSVYHYALDIYKCNITVHYYIHRVYTTNSTFTSFLFTYILVLSENSTYTFKYKIEVLSSPIAAVQIRFYTSRQYHIVLLKQSLT